MSEQQQAEEAARVAEQQRQSAEQAQRAGGRSVDRTVTGEWVDPTADVFEREAKRAAEAAAEQS